MYDSLGVTSGLARPARRGGYSTQDNERCALSARAVALIYNGWRWYVRLANPKNRMEAITSRPKLLSAVGRLTTHAGQSKIDRKSVV